MAAFSSPRGVMGLLMTLLICLQVTVAFQHGSGSHHHAHRTPERMAEHFEETAQLLQERQSGFLAITGVQGAAASRLEIRDLAANADQWNLFLLGMERFQAKAHNDRVSYYQIAGVHGRPYVSWNNFSPMLNRAGFCPHSQTLFGSWHRPYLAVFEQAWHQSMLEVIRTFPANQQGRLNNIAAGMRFPYWDWAKQPATGQTNTPSVIRDQRVTVTKPSGRVTIDNPIYSFKWGNTMDAEMGGGPWNSFPQTLRRPVANPTRSNNNELNARMSSLRISLRDRIYGLFMTRGSFGMVSTSAIGVRTRQNGNNPDSFESVHDAVHVTAGGESGGHMYFLDYSAFDPIFWLHHFNIDRLLAIHQCLSPNTYIANGNTNRPMAQWNQGEAKNSFSPLKPFTRNTGGTYWTSEDVRDTRTLGYYYPETPQGSKTNTDAVWNQVNRLYSPTSGSRKRDVTTGQYEGEALKEGDYYTVLSVQANKYALDGSYSVHCFIGKPSGDNSTSNSTAPFPVPNNSTMPSHNSTVPTNSTGDFTEDPNYVGMYGVLGGYQAGGGNSSTSVITEGSVPLTTALQGKCASGELKSLHPDDVVPYLKENLHYKIIGPGGEELDAESIPDFHVYAKSCPLEKGPEGQPPTFGEYTVLPEVTADKPAGKPFTYTPTPIDYVTPGDGEGEPAPEPYPGNPSPPSDNTSPPYPTGTFTWPLPSSPEDEEGYCVSHQTIQYVDPAGNFLYSETT